LPPREGLGSWGCSGGRTYCLLDGVAQGGTGRAGGRERSLRSRGSVLHRHVSVFRPRPGTDGPGGLLSGRQTNPPPAGRSGTNPGGSGSHHRQGGTCHTSVRCILRDAAREGHCAGHRAKPAVRAFLSPSARSTGGTGGNACRGGERLLHRASVRPLHHGRAERPQVQSGREVCPGARAPGDEGSKSKPQTPGPRRWRPHTAPRSCASESPRLRRMAAAR